MKKVNVIPTRSSYDWKFSNVGGVTRVNIETGEDIAHLHELDQKLWTVLSCPVKGLEIDEKTLKLMDGDNDEKIRVTEVITVVDWITSIIKNPNLLLKQEDFINLSDINQESEEGLKIYKSAKQILNNLGLEKDSISIADTADSMAIFAKTRFNGDGIITENSTDDENLKSVIASCIKTIGTTLDRSGADGINADQIEALYANCTDYLAWVNAGEENKATIFPYGENTATALNAYNALQEKINDYFMRCKLIAFDNDSTAALDVSIARIEAIGDKNLTTCMDEIASYPISRVGAKRELTITEGINPAWEVAFADFKRLVLDVDFIGQNVITESEWQTIGAKFNAYKDWMSAKTGEVVESLGIDEIKDIVAKNRKEELLSLVEEDKKLESEANEIQSVDKMLHIYRDLYKLIKNFVTFSDFYSRDGKTKAIFQAGTLFIDQRSCDLCIKVSDMAKHNAMAGFSGMYLIYCDCYSKKKNQTMTIAAVMTNGDVNNLMVGKNAIFYDREGCDWDATVVKIIENPISIRQAFWSPYRKFGRFIEEQVNKFASSQDEKMTSEATSKIGETGTDLVENSANPENGEKKEKPKPQAFDIAKFCGIFAAIGMAIGYIGGFLVSLGEGFLNLKWWQMPLAIVGLMLLISGPAMIMAWLKLRKRNLSPVLNANGWAINAQAYVNIPFGSTLTKIATFPNMVMQDPFAKKKMPAWKKVLIIIAALVVVFGILYFTDLLSCIGLPFHKAEVVEEVAVMPVEEAVADTLNVVADTIPVGE